MGKTEKKNQGGQRAQLLSPEGKEDTLGVDEAGVRVLWETKLLTVGEKCSHKDIVVAPVCQIGKLLLSPVKSCACVFPFIR